MLAGVLFACLIRRMSGLNDLLCSWQISTDEDGEVSLGHVMILLFSEYTIVEARERIELSLTGG